MKANELELKARAINALRADRKITKTAVIASELPLPDRGVRADLAVLTGWKFIGIEIKSNFDSLRRLDKQVKAYTETFDETILLLGEKHAQSIFLPEYSNIHVWIFEGNSLKKINSPKELQPQRKPSSSRREMLDNFKSRFSETSAAFWEGVYGRKIQSADILTLSRYHEIRSEREKEKKDLIDLWTSWNKDLNPN